MYYVVQEKLFREENYENLINTLERLELPYEIVKLTQEGFQVQTDRKDVFPFGAVRMAKLAREMDWYPGSFMTDNHDFEVYSKGFGIENMLNSDSIIIEAGRFVLDAPFFIRPCKDSKAFTGKIFTPEEWSEFYESSKSDPRSILTYDTLVQVCSPKKIYQETRFWVVKGKIVTGSMYAWGNYNISDYLVDQGALFFAKKMVDKYQLADTFVIDIALTSEGDYKIIECNCTNCSGFYQADMNKLIIALEEAFS